MPGTVGLFKNSGNPTQLLTARPHIGYLKNSFWLSPSWVVSSLCVPGWCVILAQDRICNSLDIEASMRFSPLAV
jgi:hypothetical protein